MSPELQAVIDEVASSYRDLDSVCRAQIVDPVEVADALANAEPMSQDWVILTKLALFHPVPTE